MCIAATAITILELRDYSGGGASPCGREEYAQARESVRCLRWAASDRVR